jgi:hypothetical protein
MKPRTAPPKRIFEPAGKHELLEGWLLHSHKGRDRHDEAARQLNRNRTALGIGAIIFSTLAGLSSASLGALSDVWSDRLSLVIAICGFTAALLAGVQTFLRYEERIEKHHLAGVKYKSTIRELELILTNEKKDACTQEDASNKMPSLDVLKTELDNLEPDIEGTSSASPRPPSCTAEPAPRSSNPSQGLVEPEGVRPCDPPSQAPPGGTGEEAPHLQLHGGVREKTRGRQ